MSFSCNGCKSWLMQSMPALLLVPAMLFLCLSQCIASTGIRHYGALCISIVEFNALREHDTRLGRWPM